MQGKVYMFVMNNCAHDARVLREARTLAQAGYKVTVIAVLDKITEPHEVKDGFEIIRVVKHPLHYKILRLVRGTKALARRLVLVLARRLVRGTKALARRLVLVLAQRLARGTKALAWLASINFLKFQGWALGVPRNRFLKGKVHFSVAVLLLYPLFFAKNSLLYTIKIARWFLQSLLRLADVALFRSLMLFHKPLSFLDYYIRAYHIVRNSPGDIYHAHDFNTLPVAWWAKKRLGGKLVYDSHELFVERNTPTPSSYISKYMIGKIEAFLIHKCDVVITVNESIAKELAHRYGIERPRVLMNAPPSPKEPRFDPERSLRATLGISGQYKILLYSGGITFGRGLSQVIEAIEYLPYCHLVIMGYGAESYIEYLKDVAAKEGVSSRVSFFGPVPSEEVTAFASTADLGIAPIENRCLSYYYCSPNKLFEYIAAGLPVVASNFPELKRIIEGYGLGTTFDPEDPRDIARAINEVLSDPVKYEEMRQNALNAAKIFNWENESEKLLAIYKSLEGDHNV